MQKQHVKAHKFLTTILIIFCLSIAYVFMYKTAIDKIVDNKNITIESFKVDQFNVIWSTLNTLQLEAEKEVTTVSQNIENDILSLSNAELDQLEIDMKNNVLNQNLHNILNSNIKDVNFNDINNHMNGIVVMTTSGYLEDFNYYRAVDKNESNIREWQIDINNSYNAELGKDAIDKLLNRNSGIIALESYNLTKNDNHIMINELTYDSLLNVFMNEGICGLRNYQIFVPYYITDFGDIFGNPDIIHGTKVENNKLIVVQEFNLYDQIMYSHDSLFDDKRIEEATTRYNELLRLMYIFGIALITGVIALVLYLCNIYNCMVSDADEDDEYNDNDSYDEIQDIE